MARLFYLLLLAAIVSTTWCQDYEQDEKPVVRTRQARGPSLPRTLPRQNLLSKSTTTTEAPLLEEEYADEEFQEGDIAEEEPQTTTTEAPKKPFRGVMRPFRSNEDLIEALKRRRAQAGRPSIVSHQTSTSTTTEQTSTQRGGRKAKANSRFSPRGESARQKTTEAPISSTEETRPRLYSARGGRRF